MEETHVGTSLERSTGANSAPKFCATEYGTKDDNPTVPSDIDSNEEVRRRTVYFQIYDTSYMDVSYSVRLQNCPDP